MTNGESGDHGADAPTRKLPGAPSAAVGDRCASCSAPLAVDQRYCVECGERRGKARFPVEQGPPQPSRPVKRPPRARSRPRLSSGATLVAGVATLLLAMGLGLLIGRSSNSQPVASRSPAVQVVTVQGSGAGSGAASAPAATAPAAAKPAHGAAAAAAKVTKKKALSRPPTAAAAKKANAAAGKVLGNSHNLAPATVSTGQTCTSGAGCQGGHFTGTFFPGG